MPRSRIHKSGRCCETLCGQVGNLGRTGLLQMCVEVALNTKIGPLREDKNCAMSQGWIKISVRHEQVRGRMCNGTLETDAGSLERRNSYDSNSFVQNQPHPPASTCSHRSTPNKRDGNTFSICRQSSATYPHLEENDFSSTSLCKIDQTIAKISRTDCQVHLRRLERLSDKRNGQNSV